MQLTTYEPNWANKAVQAKLKSSLEWCNFCLNSIPKPVSSNELNKVFGSANHAMSAYLRANLLIQSGQYIIGKKCFDYSLNRVGYEKLKAKCSNAIMFSTPKLIKERYKEQLQSFEFEYNTKSDRYYHGLQNIRRDKKAEFWTVNGLPFDYDIEACAPTILLHLAKKYGFLDILAEDIDSYLQNKNQMREHVAQVGMCDLNTAKRVINAMFNGAKISTSPFQHALDGISTQGKKALKEDKRVRLLVMSIKHMWMYIERAEGKLKKSTQKWSVYFRYERRILDAAKNYMDRHDVKYFTEHDGWRCNQELDLIDMTDEIQKKTGIRVKLTNRQLQHMFSTSRITPILC